MAKTSTAMEVGQEGSLREGLEAAIRERVREIIEMHKPRRCLLRVRFRPFAESSPSLYRFEVAGSPSIWLLPFAAGSMNPGIQLPCALMPSA